MQSRSNRWLVLGAVLLGLAAWLMSQDDDITVGKAPKIDFPKYLTEPELKRLEKRRIETMQVPTEDTGEQELDEPRDPILRAFGSGDNESILVFEANAIRHSALGAGFLNCLGDNVQKNISRLQNDFGINPLEDIDRMAMGDNSVMFSGNFENVQWNELFETEPEAYGDNALFFTEDQNLENPEQEVTERVALWNNELLIIGKTREEIENTIDTLEGRTAMTSIPLHESETYGEAYGNMSTKLLGRLIPDEAGALREEILKIVSGVKLHSNAMSDVAISARLTSDGDIDALSELGRSMGGALSLALAAARLKGDQELAELLEFARVTDNDGELSLELALPETYLKKHLDKACSEILKGPEEFEEGEFEEAQESDFEADEDDELELEEAE